MIKLDVDKIIGTLFLDIAYISGKHRKIYFYGKAHKKLSHINIYVVDNSSIQDLWSQYITTDYKKSFKVCWNKILDYFSKYSAPDSYTWSVILVEITDNHSIKVKYIYEDIDRDFDSEHLIKWEYLTLGLTEQIYLLDDKDQKKLLKQPPGNPFKGLEQSDNK